MKKIVFTLAMFSIAMIGYAQTVIKEVGNKVGIGTTAPSAKLQVVHETNLGEVSQTGMTVIRNTQINVNGTSYDTGIYSRIGSFSIPSGITDSGYKIGLNASSFAVSNNFAGTLNGSYGIWARAGIHVATPGATIKRAIAVNAEVLDNITGTTIENAYGVFISTNRYKQSNVINRYDLYAGTAAAKNYFAGKVGIGVANPSEKLHIDDGKILVTPKNDNESSILRINEYRGGSLLDFSEVGDAGVLKVGYYGLNQDRVEINGGASNTGSEIKGYDNAVTKFQFKSNGSSFLNGGNVGIGKTTPTEKLHIEGNLLIDAFEKGNESGIFFREGFSQSNKYNLSILAYDHNGSSADGLSVNGYDGISFSTGSGTRNERMRINQNGNVGIGTTDTKGFKLGVNGKIATTEVKVATYANWSDFVFEKEYKLPTLAQVENHIKEKGHLKDIPSAAEVKKEGFFLGEMDAKLLQKIEELTLYTIEQEKELKKQKEEINQLKNQNKELLKLAKEIELIKQKLK